MQENIEKLILKGEFIDPHNILGLQTCQVKGQVIRLWRPKQEGCELEVCGQRCIAKKVHEAGLYEFSPETEIDPLSYKVVHPSGELTHDPYVFEKAYGDLDVHLLTRGLHYELYDRLGATKKVHNGIEGTHFAVWAPNAFSVSLVGDFNRWCGKFNPMRKVEGAGIWEIFIPGLSEGEKYKFEVITSEGEHLLKSDPVGHHFEVRPGQASIVYDVGQFEWTDGAYLSQRGRFRLKSTPLNIYEVHLGSWRQDGGEFLNYRELAHQLSDYSEKMCYTHIELIGLCEHPLDESWGYQVSGYFAPTSRHGNPADFQYMVNHLHSKGIGVILDWVPGHFPTDSHSIARFDGTYLYEHIDPRQGYHPEWNTHIFNYGRWEVSNFLIASALFWFEKMHIDGFRVDAVSSMLYLDYGRKAGQWIPNKMGTNINLEALEFIKHLNSIIRQKVPDVLMIAEEATAFPGVTKPVESEGLGFDFKWNLGWMNDTIAFFSLPFAQRAERRDLLTHIEDYNFEEKYALVLSHDEVVHLKKSLLSKMPGHGEEPIKSLLQLYSFLMSYPGKKLLFMGGEFGQHTEWDCKEQLSWDLLKEGPHQKLHEKYRELCEIYRSYGPLFERDYEKSGYTRIETPHGLAYLRHGDTATLLCVHNFEDRARSFDLPFSFEKEVWNSSDEPANMKQIAPLSTHFFDVTDDKTL